jgi:hypothetical protein
VMRMKGHFMSPAATSSSLPSPITQNLKNMQTERQGHETVKSADAAKWIKDAGTMKQWAPYCAISESKKLSFLWQKQSALNELRHLTPYG